MFTVEFALGKFLCSLFEYGLGGIRTHGLCNADAALYQLSHQPLIIQLMNIYKTVFETSFRNTIFLPQKIT